jgi:DnaJ-class molecular chaperone
MTVEAIKEAIVHLSDPERRQLSDWFDELKEEEWDRQMEQDFSPGGRGAHLIEKIERDIVAGNFSSLEDGLRERRDRGQKQ